MAHGIAVRRSPAERGICLDHHAALVIFDGRYRVLTLPGKPGSLTPDGRNVPGEGVPAVWLKSVSEDGRVLEEKPVAECGALEELLPAARGAVVEDPRVETARAENPSDDLPE